MQNYRLRELDFLRGIAILLVLLRHQPINNYAKNIGWIGVDLFFVLSGFLVSSLLFKEYIKYGTVNPKLFLIRRGFKIYPIYFLVYPLYILHLYIPVDTNIYWIGFLGDLMFLQNYITGWGYALGPSWSLAIEEHFYFIFSLSLWLFIKNKFKIKVDIIIILLIIICLLMRIVSIYFYPIKDRLFTMSHLRFDSLLSGVLVSYFYYFKKAKIESFFYKNKQKLLLLAFLLLSFTPFISPLESRFVLTIGFTLVHSAFGILLTYFLLVPDINSKLDFCFSKRIVDFISKVGLYSYSIYLINTFINWTFEMVNKYFLHYNFHFVFIFIVTTIVSIFTGKFMTLYLENYFLKIRDIYFPKRNDF